MRTEGKWPRAIKRLLNDFRREKNAPANDGIVAPEIAPPAWATDAAAQPEAIDVARRANDEAKAGIKAAEEKASRLVQTSLALITAGIAIGGFQLDFILDQTPRLLWWLSIIPIVLALSFLGLATFESLEIDRVS